MPTPVAASAAAEVRGELRTLRANDERDRSELQRVSTRIEQLEERTVRLAADIERLSNEYETAESAAALLEGEVVGASERRLAAEVTRDAAAQAASAYNNENRIKEESQIVDFFKQQGLQVTTPDLDAFRKTVQGAYQNSDYAKVWPKGLVERINNTK